MASVGSVVIDVTADIGPLVTQMDRAKTSLSGLSRFASDAGRGLQSFGSRATQLGKSLSIATAAISVAAGAALALTRNAAEVGDRIGDAAAAAGVSTKFFQETAFAMEQVANATEEEFGAALTILNRKLGEAQQGSKPAIAAFEAIGVSAADIRSGAVTTEQAFDALVKKLGEVQDPALAAAIATDVLGKQGARMGSAMAGGATRIDELRKRANELGVVLSDDSVKAAGKFDDKMKELSKGFESVKLAIASELLPIFVDTLIPALTDTVIPALRAVVGVLGEWVAWFRNLPGPVQEAVGVLAAAFATGGPLLVGIGLVSTTLGALIAATGPVGLFIAAAGLAAAAWIAWGDDIKAAVGGAIDWIVAKFDAFLDILQTVLDKLKEIGGAIVSALTPGYQAAGEGGFEPDVLGQTPMLQGMTGAFQGDTGMAATGAAAADGLVNGFTTQMQSRLPEIGEAVNQIPQAARDVLQVQSPSVVMQEIGQFVGQGLANGIRDSEGLLRAAMNAGGQSIISEGDKTVQGFLQNLDTLFSGSKAIALGIAAVNIGRGLSEAISLPFPASIAAFAKVAAMGAQALSTIKGARKGGGSIAGGRGGGGDGGGGGGAPAPSTYVNVRLNGGDNFSGSSIRSLISEINKAIEGGAVLKGISFNR